MVRSVRQAIMRFIARERMIAAYWGVVPGVRQQWNVFIRQARNSFALGIRLYLPKTGFQASFRYDKLGICDETCPCTNRPWFRGFRRLDN
jgi:hypothetical protein